MSVTPHLLLEHPAGGRSRHAIDHLPFEIGRQPDNQLAVRDNRISRRHARITHADGHYVIEDLDSRSGVFVNGQRLTGPAPLESGDQIDFGVEDGYRLTFSLDSAGLARLMGSMSESGAAAPGAQNLAKLRSLVEVARALQTSLSIDDVLEAVVDAALTITATERGFLMLRQGEDLTTRVARDCSRRALSPDDLRVPAKLIQRALNSRRDMLSMNFDPYAGSDPSMTVAQLELRSVICVPLVKLRSASSDSTQQLDAAQDTVGLLYLDSRATHADLSAGNRELLQTLALEASTILENARLLDEERKRVKLDEEMGIAREIQQSLLPRILPVDEWFSVCGSSQPAAQVGGDYFDVRPAEQGGWSIVVADVSGKGVSSALMASLLQGAFIAAHHRPELMTDHLARVNRFLLERMEGEKYATVFYAILQPDGLLHYANTGICPPAVVRTNGQIERLESNGMPLGLFEEATYELGQLRMEKGDVIVAFSDGVEDSSNAAGESFGKARVREALRPGGTPNELHVRLRDAALAFAAGAPQADDLTVVAFGYRPNEA
ncbi:MAG: SpoIIE family protein phosphatase [Bryobacteraceae bacterium]|nr:SpoIIE family protein phosphatase [Bryobacteraceae bacterium]